MPRPSPTLPPAVSLLPETVTGGKFDRRKTSDVDVSGQYEIDGWLFP